jgi:hypothetical protein
MHKTDLEARLRRHALHALLALDQKTVTREVEPRCTRERTQNLSAHKAIEQTKSKTGTWFLTGTRDIKRETSSGRRNPGARDFLIRATNQKPMESSPQLHRHRCLGGETENREAALGHDPRNRKISSENNTVCAKQISEKSDTVLPAEENLIRQRIQSRTLRSGRSISGKQKSIFSLEVNKIITDPYRRLPSSPSFDY